MGVRSQLLLDLSSTSLLNNLEHIFAELPQQGFYSLEVQNLSTGPVDFGFAWWLATDATVGVPEPATLTAVCVAATIALRRRRA